MGSGDRLGAIAILTMTMQTQLSRESIVQQSRGQVSCELDGEVVAMSLEGGRYYKLDAVGAATWALLAKPTRVADLCEELRRTFAVEAGRCEAEVLAFLEDLRRSGLLAWGDEVVSR